MRDRVSAPWLASQPPTSSRAAAVRSAARPWLRGPLVSNGPQGGPCDRHGSVVQSLVRQGRRHWGLLHEASQMVERRPVVHVVRGCVFPCLASLISVDGIICKNRPKAAQGDRTAHLVLLAENATILLD